MNKFLRISIIYFTVIISLFGQQSKFIKSFYANSGILGKYSIKQWSSDEGLPQNSIYDIAQTKDGYLWIATISGLVRFDGYQFVTYNTSNTKSFKTDRIRSVAADSNNGLWIGTWDGDIVYYKDNRFNLFSNKLLELDTSIPINQIKVDKFSTIWFSTEKGVIRYKKNVSKYYPITNYDRGIHAQRVTCINVYNPNNILVGTSNGLITIAGDSIKIIHEFDKKIISSIENNRLGTIWIGTETNMYMYKNGRAKLQSFSTAKIKNINGIFSDSKNRLWIGTTYQGLFINSRYEDCEFESKRFNSTILKIFEDIDHNIWIGTRSQGLFRITDRKFFNIPLANKIFRNTAVSILERKNGEIWVGSFDGGLARIKNGSIKYFSRRNGLLENKVFVLNEAPNQKLWIGYFNEGLQYWMGTTLKNFKYLNKLSSRRIFTIFSDINNNLWIGTANGLNYFHNDILQIFSTKDGLYNNTIKAITETKNGIIWIGTNNGLNFYKHGKIYKFKFPDETTVYNIESFFIDNLGRLWIGTYGQGLYCYYKNKVYTFTKKDGLFDNVILTIIEDKSNNFWMSSNGGLFKVKEKNLTNFMNGKDKEISSFVYQKSDGFLSNEFNGGNNAASCMLDDGTLLFVSMGGVVAVDPSLKDKYYPKHKIFINNITVNGKNTFNDSVIVPSDNNDIVFHFSAIRFNKPNQIRLFFRIKNLTHEWIWLKNKRSLNFADIPTGNYLLELKKVIGSRQAIAYTSKKLIVLPRFYQTNLFKFLLLLSFIITFFLLIKIRFISLEKKRHMLQKTVEERTLTILLEKKKVEKISNEKSELLRIVSHNLKNPIGVIRNSTELMLDEPDNAETVSEISKIIKSSADNMLSSVSLLLQSCQLDEDGFALNKTKFDFVEVVKNVIEENKISALKKKQKIIFKPYNSRSILIECDHERIVDAIDNLISNAIKYSGTGKTITVTIENDNAKTKFSVIDDGPGLNDEDLKKVFGKFVKLSAKPTAGENSTGLGLSIVKRIIEKHGGTVGVNSIYGKGSEFYFTLPIK